MSPDLEVSCAKCAQPNDRAAVVCHCCGYSPAKKLRNDGLLCIVAGFAFSATGIGLLIGIPLIWIGVKRLRKARDLPVSYRFR